jgi:glycosyltransferase involved in cell wall biosynthesis
MLQIPTSAPSHGNSNCLFVVFSDDWDEHPSSCQHLFRRISREYDVIWVNTIGMRNPSLTWADAKKGFRKLGKMIAPGDGRKEEESRYDFRLTVVQPLMVPFSQLRLVRWINKHSVHRSVENALSKQGPGSRIIVTTVPNACDYVGEIGASRIVYYCVDDFTEWPGLNRSLVKKMEAELVMRSDVFVATSEKLYESLKVHGKPTYLLTHGVDVELFARAAKTEHPILLSLPKPRVGFFGLYDDRSDYELISRVASLLPDVSFVFAGPIASDASRLREHDNIYFVGKVDYEDLPSLVLGFDVLMLPYLVNRLTDSISPLKLKEYLATGKPVVSTGIKEAMKFDGVIKVARSVDQMADQIRMLLSGKKPYNAERARSKVASEHWAQKAKDFLSICLSSNQ